MNQNEVKLDCTVFPGKFRTGEAVPPLYNLAYEYWGKTWGEIFAAAGSPDSLNVDNFLRQDIVIVLHSGDQITGVITSCLFNLSATPSYDHSYFKAFPADVIRSLRENGSGLAITGEYLSVHPSFRKSHLGIALSDVLIGLLMKVFRHLDAKVSLATTVRPAGVHKIGVKFGWSELGNFKKYGLDCVLLLNSRAQHRDHNDPKVIQFVNQCWEWRVDYSGLTNHNDTNNNLGIAA